MPELKISHLALVAALLLLPAGASAQDQADKLRQVQSEIEETKVRSEALDREGEKLSRETASLRRRLVGLTARVLEKEAAVEEAEANLIALEKRENEAQALF